MGQARTNSLSVWWLGNPARPALIGSIGSLRSAPGTGGGTFDYAAAWLTNPLAHPLSEDLPLLPGLFLPASSGGAPGALDDARPDQWGERLIQAIYRPERLSVLEYLHFAGDHRPGALGISADANRYSPIVLVGLPSSAHLGAVYEAVQAVLRGSDLADWMRQLLAPGAGLGGTRPKALVDIDRRQWIVKFSAPGDLISEPSVEHAAMTLARRAGINACRTRPLGHRAGGAVAVERFDRCSGRRLHVISARTALRAAGAPLSYPAMAQLLRRLAPAESLCNELEELFRRLVFNILIDNTDDHEKNHAFYFDGQAMRLTPAYDVLPAGHALGYQAMTVGDRGAESTLENALSCLVEYGIRPGRAIELMREVATVVHAWHQHFLSNGVSVSDMTSLSAQIDSPSLAAQRQRAMAGDFMPEALRAAQRRDADDVAAGRRDPRSLLAFQAEDLEKVTLIEGDSSEYIKPGDGW